MPHDATREEKRLRAVRAGRVRLHTAVSAEVLGEVMSEPWGISQEGLVRVMALAERRSRMLRAGKTHALERQPGAYVPGTGLTVRDGVALLRISGPLFNDSSYYYDITSYSDILADLDAAISMAAVNSVVLAINSPGGQVHGCWELGEAMASMRGVKPLVAYVEGDACSAAYWLAAQCDAIVAAKTAVVGCLGVQAVHWDYSKLLDNWGIREVVVTSSQTPEKNRAPTDAEGAAQWQAMVDEMAEVFLTDVSVGRGIAREEVDAKYGRGAVLVGARALAAGMVDRLDTYEALHAELAEGRWNAKQDEPTESSARAQEKAMTSTRQRPAAAVIKPGANNATSTPTAAAFDDGAEVQCKVTRTVGINSGDRGTVREVRTGDFYRVQTGDSEEQSYAWLAEDELEVAAAEGDAPADGENARAKRTVRAVSTAIASARAAGAQAENARVQGILALAKKYPLQSVLAFVADGATSAGDAALKLLASDDAAGAAHIGALAGDEASIVAPAAHGAAPTLDADAQAIERVRSTLAQFTPSAVITAPNRRS